MSKCVFVTVGTTSFDALIRAVDTKEFHQALLSRGYTSLVLQIGRGSYVPECSSEAIRVKHFTFAPNLSEYMSSASLIISHAGSGSIFESLRARKPLVVVVNEDLMDNHQSELAEELASSRYLFYSNPASLVDTLKAMDLERLCPYPVSTPAAVVHSLDAFLGFNS